MTTKMLTTRVVENIDTLARMGLSGPVVLLCDQSLVGHPGVTATLAALQSFDRAPHISAVQPSVDLDRAIYLADELSFAATVVAVGGGSVIDLAKLALAVTDPIAARIAAASQRSGWVVGPESYRKQLLVAVPTTLGTASELSAIASFVHRNEKRAYTSRTLSPDIAIVDPRATSGLPKIVIAQSILEIFLRAVGPLVGGRGPLSSVDRIVIDLAAEAMARAQQIHDGVGCNDSWRAEVARLSRRTLEPRHLDGREGFTTKAWFIANNLSHHLGLSKMAVLLNVIPAIWSMLGDHPALGSVDRLEMCWSRLSEQWWPALHTDPATGFSDLLDRLNIAPLAPLGANTVAAVTRSCVRMWGAGLPMLGGVTPDVVAEVVRRSRVCQPHAPTTYELPLAQRVATPKSTNIERRKPCRNLLN